MNPVVVIHLLAGCAAVTVLIIFTTGSFREKKIRAASICLAALILFTAAWLGLFFLFRDSPAALGIPSAAVLLAGILFFFPSGRPRGLCVDGAAARVDERDVIFAREEYGPGTDKYERYYAMRPENKAIDDRLRKLPELLEPGGRYYDPAHSGYIGSLFEALEGLTTEVDGKTAPRRAGIEPRVMTELVKSTARRLGADDVGIAELDPMYVYSHVGRGPEEWGRPIENNHRFAVVIALEMDYGHVGAAPRLPITRESAAQYLKGAQITIALARTIRSLGYPARAHIAGSNYQIMLPPVAHDAGLGELGRMGYLISPRFGARVRLGAVTTDLPLIPDKPVVFGVQDFCAACRKCALNCPSGAIPQGGRERVRGVEKWPLDIEQCLHYWRVIGTDCGLCMKVCPYSHPATFVHNLVRAGIKRTAFARRVSVWGDDLLYGKRLRSVRP